MTTLAQLNDLRIANGKRPLKSWKESKAKLHAYIEVEKAMKHSKALEASIKDELAAQPTPAPAKADKPAKPSKPKADGKTFTIASLAADLGKSPKVIRAKARLHQASLPKPVAKHTYDIKHYDAVKKALG